MNKPPAATPLLKNAANAPVIFFDGVPVCGMINGIVELELAVRLLMPRSDGSVYVDMSCVAHLRCNANSAMQLREVIDKALALSNATEQQKLDS